jgi:hypothetical protein
MPTQVSSYSTTYLQTYMPTWATITVFLYFTQLSGTHYSSIPPLSFKALALPLLSSVFPQTPEDSRNNIKCNFWTHTLENHITVGVTSHNVCGNSIKTWIYNFISSQFGGVTIDEVWAGEWVYWPLIPITQYYKQLQHFQWSPHFTNHYTLSLFPACGVSNSHSLTTASNSGDSSASHTHIVTVWWISRNWTHSPGLTSSLYSLGTDNRKHNLQQVFLLLLWAVA